MIRDFRTEDAKAVAGVVHDALLNTNTHDYPQRIIDRIRERFTPEFFLNKSQEDSIIVAEQEGVIIGTARLDTNLITNTFVSPDAQNQGIGRALTAELEKRARARGYTFVRVYGSLSAIGFYEQLGYEQVDVAIHEIFGTNAVMKKSFA